MAQQRRPVAGLTRVLPYAVAAVLAVVVVVVSVTRSEPSEAAQEALGGKQLKIMAPADPGGGWDSTAREMQSSLQDILGRTEVYNVGGAGGTIGLSNFRNLEGQPNQLMVMGLVMVGAIAANDSSVTLDEVTPIAELTTESLVVVVPADSDIQTIDDLVTSLEQDLGSVSWAGGSAGGAEQILAGLVAQDLEQDPADVNYIAHAGGGEAIATLLSGSATAGISGVSEFLPQIESGALRAIAVSGTEPVEALPDTPTLQESGIDVELTNWRGVVAPPGITESERQALVDLVTDMTGSEAWDEALARQGWTSEILTGDDFEEFLDQEVTRVDEVVAELGI
ncbi:Bug family tripartite tricarboxylate transporter substrate binding protein [Nocardioides euryhalodurans]|uniref:Tripartite tricarboxylate transporter substrate binding protein n=1 Tax=Nocardioides euryhalodurans TaxID=2518370 RepID=A0A4P7GL13_9ACTN|nr:tripartite tricarboxylate transporter substrate binding protein [Nocardioides euryhalodurans]QBR92808.1 tripartite tricarboxylate transporter substrate binding protein [Nocardioides euryhalodurans]